MNSTSTSSRHHPSAYRQALRWGAGFLMVAHIAGVIGLTWPVSRPYFEWATPLNLLVSAALLLLFHTQWNKAFYIFLAATLLLGYGIEVFGVHTEAVFGTYQYGDTLGLKVADVPLVIGVNWFMLTYSVGSLCHALPGRRIFKSLAAALLMVLLDYFIEPVAMFFDFWQWEGQAVPLQNYLGWLAVAWVMQLLFFFLPFTKKNPLAPYFVAIQAIFFLLLSTIVV